MARGCWPLTTSDANHTVVLSADAKHYVDTYSRVDAPPVTELRRTSDGELVATLEKADITELVKAGWKAPEVFVAKGRDGGRTSGASSSSRSPSTRRKSIR